MLCCEQLSEDPEKAQQVLGSHRSSIMGDGVRMRIRKRLDRRTLPTAWASSCSRNGWSRVRPLLGVAIATLLVPSSLFASVQAQQAATPATKPPPACASAEYRAFDFWIGVWDVTAAG